MYTDPKTEATKNTNAARQHKANAKTFRIIKWTGTIIAIVPPVILLIILLYAGSSMWSAFSVLALAKNPLFKFFEASFFPLIIIGVVSAVVGAFYERKLNKQAKFCGDMAYYLRLYERNSSYEDVMKQLQVDVDEAIKNGKYAQERNLQMVQAEIGEILRGAPKSNTPTHTCTHCGTPTKPDAKFCKNCGKPI